MKLLILLITMLALILVPFIGGFFMFVLKDPSLAQKLGFISAKAHIMGTALGFMVFTLVLAQIIAATGYGQFFPWSIPALVSSAAGSDSSMIEGISIIIVILTSVFGLEGTMFWWRYADQS